MEAEGIIERESRVTAEKLRLLRRIAIAFHRADICWAVGASLLLFFHKRCENFHDLDLMVAEADAEEAAALLRQMGKEQRSESEPGFRSNYFYEFEIEGIEVDLMAGFIIVRDGVRHYFPLTERSVHGKHVLDGVEIPLQSLDDWQNYYELMGRDAKARLCRRDFSA